MEPRCINGKDTSQFFLPIRDARTYDFSELNARFNIYFGVGLRDGNGGKKENVTAIPSIWADIDFKSIPKGQADAKLSTFPLKPSIIINSGWGYHLYWLLKEPALQSDILRVESLNRRLCAFFDGDTNAVDAARVLRIPGTLNLKYNPPRLVTIENSNPGLEYNLEDFDEFLPEEASISAGERKPSADMDQLRENFLRCEFLRHCHDNRPTLSEPDWYKMISIVSTARPGGPELCHEFSRGYPNYDRKETDQKILHALSAAGPATCAKIQQDGFKCGKDCGVTSPATLEWKKKVNQVTSSIEFKWITDIFNPSKDGDFDPGDLVVMTVGATLFPPDLKPPVIGSGIMPEGSHIVISGPAGSGKSFLRTQMALCIAHGLPFLGFEIRKPRRVCMFQWENTEELEEERLHKYAKALGIEKLGGNLTMVRRSSRFNLGKEGGVIKMARIIERAGAEVIFLDSLSNVHSKNENDNAEMRQVLDAVGHVCANMGTSAGIIHHWGKPQMGRENEHRTRGASSIRDAIWTEIGFSRLKSGETKRKLEFFKIRSGPQIKPIYVDEDPESGLFVVSDPDSLCPPETVVEILTAMGGRAETQKELTDAIAKEIGRAPRNCIGYVKNALDDGFIQGTASERKNAIAYIIRNGFIDDRAN